MVKAIPEGYRTVTPFLNLRDCDQAIAFYQEAFGAEVKTRAAGPDGKVMHAEIKIGDSLIMLSEAVQQPPSVSSIWLYVGDCDALYNRAVAAGAAAKMPMGDMFWGDRFGTLSDPFGIGWSIATHREDVAPAEMDKRMKEFMAKAK